MFHLYLHSMVPQRMQSHVEPAQLNTDHECCSDLCLAFGTPDAPLFPHLPCLRIPTCIQARILSPPATPVKGVGQSIFRLDQAKILPGFRMPLGSKAFLIESMTAIEPGPASFSRDEILPAPIPCSPVHVPPISIIASVM